MSKRLAPLVFVCAVASLVMPACGGGGGGSTNTGGSTSLSGNVISGATGGGIGGMTVTILSGPDAGRSTMTNGGGNYSFGAVAELGVEVGVQGPKYEQAQATAHGSVLDFTLLRKECLNSNCNFNPIGCNEQLPMFSLPFANTMPFISAAFDHTSPYSEDGKFLSFCGSLFYYDGHAGWDFPMPIGTPILAAAKGKVVFAGKETPFFCKFLGRTVSGMDIVLSHASPYGEEIQSVYAHLSVLLVQEGQSVGEGRRIALSGNTGCSTGPHLHFEVQRELGGPNNPGFNPGYPVDPFGWQGLGRDPWAIDSEGAVSAWMWKGASGMAMQYSAETTRDRQNLPIRPIR